MKIDLWKNTLFISLIDSLFNVNYESGSHFRRPALDFDFDDVLKLFII